MDEDERPIGLTEIRGVLYVTNLLLAVIVLTLLAVAIGWVDISVTPAD
jgi:hypothetical protein